MVPPPFRLAFTGTRKGLSPNQYDEIGMHIRHHVAAHGAAVVSVHGAAKGGDFAFHRLCLENGVKQYDIFPSDHPDSKVDECRKMLDKFYPLMHVHIHEPVPPLQRNHSIVEGAAILYVCPDTPYEVRHSGTWATKRLAEKMGVMFEVIEP